MKSFDGRVAAITGAGSGIGRALAEQLSQRGAHLALSDIDEVALAETVAQCEGRGVKITSQRVDVSDRAAVNAWADQAEGDHGKVNLIFNNAGVALLAPIESMRFEDLEWLMSINFWGVVHGTLAFLPKLKSAGEGHVVNMSSVFGLLAIPSQSAYNAAKFAVRGFTDSLRIELDAARCGVSSTTVHPGGVNTNIVAHSRIAPEIVDAAGGREEIRKQFRRAARTSPESAARQILSAVERNKRRVLVGADAKFIDLVARGPAAIPQRVLAFGFRHRR